jgi:hypothetical protein
MSTLVNFGTQIELPLHSCYKSVSKLLSCTTLKGKKSIWASNDSHSSHLEEEQLQELCLKPLKLVLALQTRLLETQKLAAPLCLTHPNNTHFQSSVESVTWGSDIQTFISSYSGQKIHSFLEKGSSRKMDINN